MFSLYRMKTKTNKQTNKQKKQDKKKKDRKTSAVTYPTDILI